MTKPQLVALLREAANEIEQDDSLEGRVWYSRRSDGDFDVEAFVRVDNREGQGSAIVVEEGKGG